MDPERTPRCSEEAGFAGCGLTRRLLPEPAAGQSQCLKDRQAQIRGKALPIGKNNRNRPLSLLRTAAVIPLQNDLHFDKIHYDLHFDKIHFTSGHFLIVRQQEYY
jgi:hypothetical protein